MNLIKVVNQKQLIDALLLRDKVFTQEQNVDSSIQLDQEDATCLHYVLYKDEIPIGACRLIHHTHYLKLGRFCILKEYRKNNLGLFMLLELEKQEEIKKVGMIKLSAQLHALDFYLKGGYIMDSDIFYEANIPHRSMYKIIP